MFGVRRCLKRLRILNSLSILSNLNNLKSLKAPEGRGLTCRSIKT
jgi:hypothetical protein